MAPQLGEDLDAILATALSFEAARRYPTAAALAEDLRRHLADRPVRARPPSALYQLRKYARRNRVLVGGMLSTLLVLVTGTAVSLGQAIRASAGERAARAGAYRAHTEAAAAALIAGDPARARANLVEAPEERRGWEWHHLWSRVDGNAIPMQGEVADPTALACSPAGDRVYALTGTRVLEWEPARSEAHRAIELGAEASTLARTTSGERLAVGTRDGRVLVVDVHTGARLQAFDIGPGAPNALAWSPDGVAVIVLTDRSLLRCEGGATVPLATPDRGTFTDLDLDPSGARAAVQVRLSATGNQDKGFVQLYDLADGRLLGEHRADYRLFHHAPRFSPAGDELVVGGAFGTIHVLDGETLALDRRVGGQGRDVFDLAWAPGGRTLIAAASNATLALRDARDLDPRTVLDLRGFLGGRMRPDDVIGLADGSVVVASQGALTRWPDQPSGSTLLEGHDSYAYHVGFTADGGTLVSSAFKGDLCAWDLLECRLLGRWGDFTNPQGFVLIGEEAASPRPRLKSTLHFDLATLVDPRLEDWTGENLGQALAPLGAEPVGASFHFEYERSPDGRWLVRVEEGLVRDGVTGDVVARFADRREHTAAAIHPSGERFVSFRNDAQVLALPSCEVISTLDLDLGPQYSAEFSPDGTRLAIGGQDGRIHLLDGETYEPLLVLTGHTSYVKGLAWSPDGTRLASASGDRTVRVWDSVPPVDRHAERLAIRAVREQVRPVVETHLDREGDATLAAAAVRREYPPDDPRRPVALRVLLETIHGNAP